MAFRLLVLPDPPGKSPTKGITSCDPITTISDEEFEELEQKLKLLPPEFSIQEFRAAFDPNEANVNNPLEGYRDSVFNYTAQSMRGLPYFLLSRSTLNSLSQKISPQLAKKIKPLMDLMDQSNHDLLSIAIEKEPEDKGYSIEGTLIGGDGCYLLYFVELDAFTDDDFLGWRWVSNEYPIFKITYSPSDFRFDIEDILESHPELKIKIYKWNGTGLESIGQCFKKHPRWRGKKCEHVDLKFANGKVVLHEGEGWAC